jgi:hypothetical protein
MKTNRIPIVVGVTGHRDLRDQDKPSLEARVVEIFTDLQKRYTMTPLTLLTSLAEGADRLAAHAALKCGVGIMVPLPMPVEENRKDFSTEGSQQEFSELLAGATASFVLPYGPGVMPENVGDPARRSQQYAAAGQYVLRHCHILLALWDGDKMEKTGGTSQIVRNKLSGFPPAETADWAVLNPPDSGTVFHVMTPRNSNPNVDQPFSLRRYHLNPRFFGKQKDGESIEERAEKVFESLLIRTDTFNRDVAQEEVRLAMVFKMSRSALESPYEMGGLEKSLVILMDRFAAADGLANYFQKKRCDSLGWLCFLGVGSTICLAAYHSTETKNSGVGLIWLLLFLSVAGSALWIYYRARSRGYETKHLEYRALAEGLKILFFWRLAGVHDDIGAQYLRKQRSEVDWIRLAVRASDVMTSLHVGSLAGCRWIKEQWMDSQLQYFDTNAARNRVLVHRYEGRTKALVIASLLLALCMVIVHLLFFLGQESFPDALSFLFRWLSVVLVGSLATGASLTLYVEKRAFVHQYKQYSEMRGLFALAVKECDICLDRGEMDHVRMIIRRLGHEALQENGDWVLLHRERPMEVRL